MRPALSRELNRVILELAPLHLATARAPSTFAELMQASSERALPVWDGASDGTIYADARVNHAFRAWHDAKHIAGLCDFTLAGERAACDLQCRELLLRYPSAPRLALDLLRAEVIGQACEAQRTGEFVADQYAFIKRAVGL